MRCERAPAPRNVILWQRGGDEGGGGGRTAAGQNQRQTELGEQRTAVHNVHEEHDVTPAQRLHVFNERVRPAVLELLPAHLRTCITLQTGASTAAARKLTFTMRVSTPRFVSAAARSLA